MDLPLIIFILAVIVVSLGYWRYRQKGVKADIENKEGEEQE